MSAPLEIGILSRQGDGSHAGVFAGKRVTVYFADSFNEPTIVRAGDERATLSPDHDAECGIFLWAATVPFLGFSTIALGKPADLGGLLVLAGWGDEASAEPLLIACPETELVELALDQDAQPWPEGAARTRGIIALRAQRLQEFRNG